MEGQDATTLDLLARLLETLERIENQQKTANRTFAETVLPMLEGLSAQQKATNHYLHLLTQARDAPSGGNPNEWWKGKR